MILYDLALALSLVLTFVLFDCSASYILWWRVDSRSVAKRQVCASCCCLQKPIEGAGVLHRGQNRI